MTAALPIPGRVLRATLSHLGDAVEDPTFPVVVPVRNGLGVMEINDCREYIQQMIYFRGDYEISETRVFERLCGPGDTVVDAGANIGWYTLLASRRVGPRGRVVCFEPCRDVYRQLQRTIELNQLTNVTAVRVALSDRKDTVVLRGRTLSNAGGGNIVGRVGRDENLLEESVDTVDFDSFYVRSGLGQIRLVKIDVEGAELMVLRGMKGVLQSRRCDYLLVEAGDERLQRSGADRPEILELLRSCGYRLYSVGIFGLRPTGRDQPKTVTVLAEAPLSTERA